MSMNAYAENDRLIPNLFMTCFMGFCMIIETSQILWKDDFGIQLYLLNLFITQYTVKRWLFKDYFGQWVTITASMKLFLVSRGLVIILQHVFHIRSVIIGFIKMSDPHISYSCTDTWNYTRVLYRTFQDYD